MPSTESAALRSMSGPMAVSAAMPLPRRRSAAAAANRSAKASWMPDCTRMRLAQTQVWPALRYLQIRAPCTAFSKSASSNTMNGALPPSSMEVRLTVAAHCSMSSLPTSVEPVKVSLRTKGLPVSSAPMAGVSPASTLTRPAGMSARSASSAIAKADSGVALAGLHTTVQPVARAGAILRASMALGKFQGVMQATTPTGCLMARTRLSPDGAGMVSP